MTFPGQHPNELPDYGLARSLGLASGSDVNFTSLANQLDCTRDFNQVGIIYSDGQRQWLVRPSRRIATPNQSTVSHVIVTKVTSPGVSGATQPIANALQAPSLTTEISSTVISCGAAVVTMIIAMGATAAIPISAGSSGFVLGIIAAGGIATGLQCGAGLVRLYLIGSGNEESVAWLDTQEWYTMTSTALDLISLAGAGAGLKGSIEIYLRMKKASSASVIQWLTSLSRAERKRMTIEIIRHNNPGISNSGIKAAMSAGVYPKYFPTDALHHMLQRELAKALSNSSAFAGSAISGTIRNPQNITRSGQYVIGLIQSFSIQ
ncbi:hypothetical protein PUATCC27989T_01783 [Phytobacter ursingii]|uniref:NAD synthetase n=1 Tax=Phytobacter ursingii TaxID=1972431 RepID=A0AB35RRH6_9ENTR|nr:MULTISPECIES: hypothetical protein [Enterobacteriaceae]MDV2863531.1 hypothetical protein [Phytobacter ursingii]VTP13933.1 hypothetical protein PUATCC27989T_01783 [Phytobacter ursingii]